jgi:hypothetical protein
MTFGMKLESSGMQRRVAPWPWTTVSGGRTASIKTRMMVAFRTPETSVHFNETTPPYMPEDFKLHIRRRENLKSHNL